MITTNKTQNHNEKMFTPQKANSSKGEELLLKLMRGELSAVEAYDEALKNTEDTNLHAKFKSIQSQHKATYSELMERMMIKGDSVALESGAWGDFVKMFVTASGFAGERAMIEALKQGEEHGKRQCENLIESDDISYQDKEILKNDFLSRIDSHIKALKNL